MNLSHLVKQQRANQTKREPVKRTGGSAEGRRKGAAAMNSLLGRDRNQPGERV